MSPLYRILGAGCAPLQGAAGPQCHPRCAVVGAECHPPRGAGCAPGTAPQCWLCSRQGGGCGYHPPGTASARGVLGGPLGGVCGCCGTLPVSQRVRAHLSISPGHPWASLGACSCCTWEGKVFTWENQKYPSSGSCITPSPVVSISISHGDLQVPTVVVHPNSWTQQDGPLAWVVLEN